MKYKGYTARVVFDEKSGVLFGEVEGLRDVVTFEATNVAHLKSAFRDSLDDYLQMCAERGEVPERPYSGKFLLRLDPRVHREIAIAAVRAGKSINALTNELLNAAIRREGEAALSAGQARSTSNALATAGAVEEYPVHSSSRPVTVSEPPTPVIQDWTEEVPSTHSQHTPSTPPATRLSSRTPTYRRSKKAA